MKNTKKRLVHSHHSKEIIPEMYQLCDVFYIFDILKIVCDNLYKSQTISYPKQIKNTNITPPVPELKWSDNINNPIDENISTCYDYIRQHMFIQNNALLVCISIHDEPISILIHTTENEENCFKVNLRLSDIWYNTSILEGQWALYQAHYKPSEFSDVSQYLHSIMPSGPQIIIENDLMVNNESEHNESELISINELEIEKAVDEVKENETKKIKLDLTRKNALKELPDQQNRLLRCNFYIRNIWVLAGEYFTKDSPDQYAYQFSCLNQSLNTNNYVTDTNISSINLVNSLSGVYSHQYKQDSVSFKLALYKSIPYHVLDKKIIQHFNAIPTLSSMFDFNNVIHAFVTYMGTHKPGVYILSGMGVSVNSSQEKNAEDISVVDKKVPNECGLNLVSFDVAFIPTLEVQQYIVHLIKTRGTKKPVIMQCVYCPSKRKWTPILFSGNRKEPDSVKYIKSKYK